MLVKTRFLIFTSIIFLSSTVALPSFATSYVIVAGQVKAANGTFQVKPSVVNVSVPGSSVSAFLDSQGKYSIIVPNGISTRFTIVVY